MGATPEGMGCHILLSVKMTLNARICMFYCILYQYTEIFVFLEVAKKEELQLPLNPPLVLATLIY